MMRVPYLVVLLLVLCCGCAQSSDEVQDKQSAAELELIESMKNADTPQTKAYIRKVLDEPVDEGFVLPESVQSAKTVQEASNAVGALFPEFFGKEGSEYLQAVAAHPVRYRELIQTTRAMRNKFTAPQEEQPEK